MRTSASIARRTSPPTPAGRRHLRVVPPPQARRRADRSHAPAVAALASGLALGTLMAALVGLPFGAAGAGISLRIFVAALIVAAAALARARTVTRQARARRMRTSRRQEAVAAAPPRERLRAVA
jgi:predicted lipid-binding transport protein (Tim44 family)